MRGNKLKTMLISIQLLFIIVISSVFFVSSQGIESMESMEKQNDWSMFRHDLLHSGFTMSDAPEINVIEWSKNIGNTQSSPIISNKNLYISSLVEGGISRLYCFDARSGVEHWNASIPGEIISTPAIEDDFMYVGSNNRNLYCFDNETGEQEWRFTALGQIRSSPAVFDEKVYFGCNDYFMYCVDATDGTLVWKTETDGQIKSSPAIAQNQVFVSSSDGLLYAFHVQTGTILWTYRIHNPDDDGYITSSPMVHNERIFVGSLDGNLYCIDISSHQKIWQFQTGNSVFSSPAIINDYVVFSSNDKYLYCLNASTGMNLWDYDTDVGNAFSSPAVADGKVFVGTWDGLVYCLNITNGEELWQFTTQQNCIGSPAIAFGKLYLGFFQTSYTGSLFCIGETNLPPSVSFTVSAQQDLTYNMLYFNDTSIDETGLITNWSWDFGDGNTSYTQNTTHHYIDDGKYMVTLTVTDDEGAQNFTQQQITILNRPPIAHNDSVVLQINTSVYIDVLDNDEDMDGVLNASSLVIDSPPSNGSVQIFPENHTIKYTPFTNYSGNDSFTYSCFDDDNDPSNQAVVSIAISVFPDPIARNDFYQILEDEPLEVSAPGVLSNDSDPDGQPQPLSAELINDVSHGRLIFYSTGAFDYRPDPDFFGLDFFTYHAFDGQNYSEQAVVTITVTSVNDPPVAEDDEVTIEQGQVILIDVIDNDVDPDGSLNFSSLSIVSQVNNGLLDIVEEEKIRYTPDDEFSGIDQFSYSIEDDDGAVSNAAVVSITVTGLFPPRVSFMFSPERVSVHQLVQFTDKSTDKDGTIVNWTWDFDDGNTSFVQNTQHQFNRTGTFRVSLTVMDNDGLTDSFEDDIRVVNETHQPVAQFRINPNPVKVNRSVSFTDESTDADGSIVSWNWNFGDGGSSSQQNPTHQYTIIGAFIVELEVEDDDGNTNSIQKRVTVTDENLLPTVSILFPLANNQLQGLIEISGVSSSDDANIVRVDVQIDNNGWIAAEGTTSWIYEWDTTTVPNGVHIIKVRSFDGSNYSEFDTVEIQVFNLIDDETEDNNDDSTSDSNGDDSADDELDQNEESSSGFLLFVLILMGVFIISVSSIVLILKI